jgi:hypothetical protein
VASCSQCHHPFVLPGPANVAAISGSIQGDECSEVYYFCERCGVYTVGIYWDCFDGSESASERGPVAKTEGDAKIALIRRCDRAWDKTCRCEAHVKYFGSGLD